MSSTGAPSKQPQARPGDRPSAPTSVQERVEGAVKSAAEITANAPSITTSRAEPEYKQHPIGLKNVQHPKTDDPSKPPSSDAPIPVTDRGNPIIGIDEKHVHPIIGVEDDYGGVHHDEEGMKFRKVPGFRDVGPDFVIDVQLGTGPNSEGYNSSNISKLIKELTAAGFYVEVRQGSESSILVFIKCSGTRAVKEYYKSKAQDWLHNISTVHPSQWDNEMSPDLTPAEKLRLIYSLLTSPLADGGLGITPTLGDWAFVNSIFPLHDYELNRQWIKRWSMKWVIDEEEIKWIKNHFGEKYALYFAFLQDYFIWLTIPSILGIFSYFFLGPYSKIFGILNLVWGVVFTAVWKRKEASLAYQWGSKGSSILETPRALFVPKSVVTDPVTGAKKGYYPKWKRALKELASIPLALGAVVVVVLLQMLSFALEIVIGQLYHGPLKSIFMFIPTLVLVAVIPVAISIYSSILKKFIDWENHETEDSYETSFTQKLFSLAFLTSSGGLFLTAYLYLPFGHLLRPHVDRVTYIFSTSLSSHFAAPESFDVNGARLQQQVLYLMGTAQVVKFAVGTVLPYVQRKAVTEAKRMTTKQVNPIEDDPEEADFLAEVREQMVIPVHSVEPEYQEMVLQFSHIMLFGVVWPLAPLAAMINNWIELRGDAVKICVDVRRPIPKRAESIGPWLIVMKIITWIASITVSSLLVMFGDTHHEFDARCHQGVSLVNTTLWRILSQVAFSEHAYFIFTYFVTFLFNTFQSENQIKDEQARYNLRKVTIGQGDSPVTATGVLKRDISQSIVSPAEGMWQNSSPAMVIEQAKTIIKRVNEISKQEKESKKDK